MTVAVTPYLCHLILTQVPKYPSTDPKDKDLEKMNGPFKSCGPKTEGGNDALQAHLQAKITIPSKGKDIKD